MQQHTNKNFPALNQTVHGHRLAFLDSASGTLKPRSVIDAIITYYERDASNVHGLHEQSRRATEQIEETRELVRRFLNAQSQKEIVFTSGTTEGVNFIAHTFGKQQVQAGDEVLITAMEHHANIVPWQVLCEQQGATLTYLPVTDTGELDLAQLSDLLTNRTKIVSVVHASNSIGTVNPIKKIVKAAHAKNIPVIVDGAQMVAHRRVDMQSLDADFYVFSGHKLYGPTGVGVVYGKKEHLDQLPPWQTGGKMIERVTLEKTTYADSPVRFEAGTPPVASIIGLGAAVAFMNSKNWAHLQKTEDELLHYATEKLQNHSRVTLLGTASDTLGIISFTVDGIHAHDVATVLDQCGVAVRAGHHCTQPLWQHFKVDATVRLSLGMYNCLEDIDQLLSGLKRAAKILT